MRDRYAASVARTIQRQIGSCDLTLGELVVATECANGAYASTAAAAVAAGAAHVWAYGADSRWATVEQSEADVRALIEALGADQSRLTVVRDKAQVPWAAVDIVTNSGHLRPLSADLIGALPADAVIALMFEAWELRDGDIDVQAAVRCDVPIIGVDEHHPACGAFEFVGALAVSEAMRRSWSIADAHVAVISDNAFAPPVLRALNAAGAHASHIDPHSPQNAEGDFDLAVVATTPPAVANAAGDGAVDPSALAQVIERTGAYGCVQLWGDIAREQAPAVQFSPERAPAAGHQGVAMNAAGHEATVRLQVGGLAAAFHGRRQRLGLEVAEDLITLIQTVNTKQTR